MSFTSTFFIIFILSTALIVRLLPKRFEWMALLACSFEFYALGGAVALIYITATSIAIWAVALWMRRVQSSCDKVISTISEKDARKVLKAKTKKQKKLICTLGVLALFGVLAVLKYFNFVVESLAPIIKILEGGGEL